MMNKILKNSFSVFALLLLVACDCGKNCGSMMEEAEPVEEAMEDALFVNGRPVASTEESAFESGDSVYFGYDNYKLDTHAQKVLKDQAAWLAANPEKMIIVEGRCDERGTREYNLALGERRANSAKDYLVALGVDANRIQTISYGKDKPVVLGSTEMAWALNRVSTTRIECGDK
ncbi:MAG: peptidoglycan-associated lipoprotein [Rickettsiales bacterium]|nr:peptidoglycan-associated lipoprotein [Rickettsiales bacterium]|tara:strand:+ start:5533 stop:6054 length:522 start_codon:yes stop_codon:yes gene_type:complete